MDPLLIEATEDTPAIYFYPDENEFVISERSLPENAIAFYEPIIQWLNEYIDNANKITEFHFRLEYFNTASAKQLAKVLLILERLSKEKKVQVIWHYSKDDSDMLASGNRFSKLIKIPFTFIEY